VYSPVVFSAESESEPWCGEPTLHLATTYNCAKKQGVLW
jgi:hypothetical protein